MLVDTLSIARELRAAEMPNGQAEAVAAAIGRAINENLATKSDLETLAQRLEAVKQELRGDIERSKNQLLLWFVSTQLALAGLMVALIKL